MEHRWPGKTDPPSVWNHYDEYRGELAFDVGANLGQVAQLLAPNFTRIVSFEPCAESFAILATEAMSNVEPVQMAVSNVDGEITLYEAAESIKTGQLVSSEGLFWGELVGDRQVPARTLDSLVVDYGVPDFIKVDTEGHEVQVVEGALGLIAEHHPRWLIEVHHEESGKRLKELLAPHYRLETVGHPSYRAEWLLRTHFWIKASVDG